MSRPALYSGLYQSKLVSLEIVVIIIIKLLSINEMFLSIF